MKPQVKALTANVVPAMEVYDSAWQFLGYVDDRGILGSLEDARKLYGPGASRVVPTFREVL
jgi:hypothetical protein